MQDDARRPRPDELRELVAASRTPLLVVRIPSQIVLAASPGAHEFFGHRATSLYGRTLAELTGAHTSAAMQLLADGSIVGYEAELVLTGSGGRSRVWIASLGEHASANTALAVVLKDGSEARTMVHQIGESFPAVAGTTDARLLVDRVTGEVQTSFGYATDRVLGTSLFELFATGDVGTVLAALAETSATAAPASRRVRVLDVNGDLVSCRLVLCPLQPEPSCAFALLPDGDVEGSVDARTLARLLVQLRRAVRGGLAAPAAGPDVLRTDVDIDNFTAREREIVSYLVAGDRVPAIAKRLFLSEGTIRNNLSSAFAKLGVHNQQELIELLRPAASRGRG